MALGRGKYAIGRGAGLGIGGLNVSSIWNMGISSGLSFVGVGGRAGRQAVSCSQSSMAGDHRGGRRGEGKEAGAESLELGAAAAAHQ